MNTALHIVRHLPTADQHARELVIGKVAFAPKPQPQSELAVLRARVEVLERELAMLKSYVTHSGTLAKRVVEMVNEWAGPFTARQIRDAVYARWPEARPVKEHEQVHCKLHRMAEQGFIVVLEPGRGARATIYERAGRPPAVAGRCGQKFGRRHRWQSGIILAARAALEAMPAEFTTADLKRWVAEREPKLAGSEQWGALVSHLRNSGELVTVRRVNQCGWRCVFKRGRVITSTGAQLAGKEAEWHTLRGGMNVAVPELLGPLERDGEDGP